MATYLKLEQVKPVNTVGPCPRSGHRIVVDDSNLYSLGGYNPDGVESEVDSDDEAPSASPVFAELWKYNFSSRRWLKLEMKGDCPQFLASHSACMFGNLLFTFGGSGVPFGEQSSGDVHVCHLEPECKSVTWRRLECTGSKPEKKYGHSQLVLWPYLYIIGGTTGYIYNSDVHRLDLRTNHWDCLFNSQSDPPVYWPVGRYRHEMVIYGDLLYMFGGGQAYSVYSLDEIPVFNLQTLKWEEVQAKPDTSIAVNREGATEGFPSPRRCHSCVLYKNGAFLFGGRDDSHVFGDLWRLSLDTLQWTYLPLNSSLQCFFHHADITPSGCMYIFGGVIKIDDTRSNDIHKVWLELPSLQELSWCVISGSLLWRQRTASQTELLDLGIPRHFTQRLLS